MYAYTRTLATLGAVILLVLFGGVLTDRGEAFAEPLSFDFTFTCDETVKVAAAWDTVRFQTLLTNTGTEADSYLVTLAENPPTPEDWWREFCAGGVCPLDSLITSFKIFNGEFLPPLPAGLSDTPYLDVIPRSAGQGSFTMSIESLSNPGVKLTKSLTFLLSAQGEPQAPVTGNWGMIILASLILASGLYLIYRRLKPARQT
ncbi:MAG: hypothetical protein WBD64_05235 [Candidatus Zixiibacteriota bacterium]